MQPISKCKAIHSKESSNLSGRIEPNQASLRNTQATNLEESSNFSRRIKQSIRKNQAIYLEESSRIKHQSGRQSINPEESSNYSGRINQYIWKTQAIYPEKVKQSTWKTLEFYGDFVYKFKKNMGRTDFYYQFRKMIIRHKRIGYD